MQSSNYETLRNSYHTPSNINILKSRLDEQGIRMDQLPASVRSQIGYATKVRLLKKDGSKTYPFTGLVAMLGEDSSGQLLVPSYVRKNGEVPNVYTLGKMDVFNPAALRKGKPVVVLTDFLSALRLSSYGIDAVSIGTADPRKYLIPLIDHMAYEGIRIPKIYYHLPEKKGRYFAKDLLVRDIPGTNINNAIRSGEILSDFSSFQLAQLNAVLADVTFDTPSRSKAAAA